MTILETPYAERYFETLRARLDEETFKHSIGTGQFMIGLAGRLDLAYESAAAAGLLHDIGKGWNAAQLLDRAARYNITPNDTQRLKPDLLHGPVGAEEVRHELGLDDPAVYEAIYWHTTGRPGLGPLGLALYFADFAEPTRPCPEAGLAREMLDEHGFDRALLYVADQKFKRVLAKPHIDPITKDFYTWLKTELG